MISIESFVFPFLLTLFAGLSTGIGSAIALLAKKTNKRLLSFSLGLSAGVMIYISFVELFKESQEILVLEHGEKPGMLLAILSFFAGMLLIGLIDKLVPSHENPHEIRSVEAGYEPPKGKLMRVGVLTALAIGIHNFPEGMATFTAAMQDPSLGIAIAAAVAIHNIPEGIAVSIPVFYATGSRKKAFYLSFLSGLAEPLGALIAFLVLAPFLSPLLMAYIFAIVAGIMVYISFDELLPAAQEYGEHHIAIYGLIAGMVIMAISLVLLA